MNQPPQRLNKTLAQLGYGSRRAIDALIEKGEITVNEKPAELGQKINPSDLIKIKGTPVNMRPREKVTLAFHKPQGVTTTRKDKFAKVTVMDFLPKQYQHLYPIGRLDKDSRGLLLLTNDGMLAQKLEHPRYDHEKEYEVEIIPTKPRTLSQFKQDIARLGSEIIDPKLQDKIPTITTAHFDSKANRGTVTLILKEGKNRQIRHLFETLGYFVSDLVRTRIDTIMLDNINEGGYVLIDHKQLTL